MSMKNTMMAYTINRLVKYADFDLQTINFLVDESRKLNETYENICDPDNFNFFEYSRKNIIWVCKRNGAPIGFMMAKLYLSGFNNNVKILSQTLLYSKSPGSRASYLLMKHFIDFGKLHADYIDTTIGKYTNIKSRSLKKLGFNKLEEIYRLETK